MIVPRITRASELACIAWELLVISTHLTLALDASAWVMAKYSWLENLLAMYLVRDGTLIARLRI